MGLGTFMGKDPESRHLRGLKKECIKIIKLKDEDIGGARGDFKKGGCSHLIKMKAKGKEPGFSQVCE
ncbi:hypothetical protein HDU67_004331 [Dinochytrium kinnereticum]|nr:hypothetical protein HDU67_004331 [Dinochytrium kinnereticum]